MDKLLTRQQEVRALQVMREYLEVKGPDERPLTVVQGERDRQRLELISKVLCPLVNSYLGGKVPLANFKTEIDSINKKNEYWGFKGIKGQMFFNMVVNVADDAKECDQELKSALAVPTNEQIASSRIKTFASYIKRLGNNGLVKEILDMAHQKLEAFLSFCLTFGRFKTVKYGQFIIPTQCRR